MSSDEEELSAWLKPLVDARPPAEWDLLRRLTSLWKFPAQMTFGHPKSFHGANFSSERERGAPWLQENKEEKMKKTILSILAVSAAAAFAVDETTTSTTTTSTTYGTGT